MSDSPRGSAAPASELPFPSSSWARDSNDSTAAAAMAHQSPLQSPSQSPSVLSDTGQFVVRYNDGASVAPTPMAAHRDQQQRSPRQQLRLQQQQQEEALDQTQVSAASSPDATQQQSRQAFSFSAAPHSPSPSATSEMSPSALPTPSSSGSGEVYLSSTTKFTPSPSASPSAAPTPVAALRSPQQTESPQLPATEVRRQRPHQEQEQEQLERTPLRPSSAAPFREEKAEDSFRQLGGEAAQMQHQQQQLLRNSTSLSHGASGGASTNTSFARTMVAPTRTPTRPQLGRDEEEKQASPSQAHSSVNVSSSFSQTVPRSASPGATAAALSTLSARALRQKVVQIERLISDFDAKFLESEVAAGASGGGGRYPAWALPFVEEMAAKLDAVLAAQRRAEEKEEREAQAAATTAAAAARPQSATAAHAHLSTRDGALHLGDLASSRGRGNGVRMDSQEQEQRALEREAEGRGSTQRARDIAALQAAPHPHHSASRLSQSQTVTPSRPSGRFYPEDVYTVELNEDLPFLRGHGSFSSRRAAASSRLASPRRNTSVTMLQGPGGDTHVPYQQKSPQPHQQQQQQQQVRERERARSRSRSRASATSAQYLTSLLGHDVGASTFNRLFRSTDRSPSPRRRVNARSVSPGRANTLGSSSARPKRIATAVSAEQGKQGSRREREIQLEMEALKLRVDELMHTLVLQERAREAAHLAATAAAASAPQTPASPPRRFQLNQSSSTTSLHLQGHQEQEREGIDESELASALVRIGEANRAKFLGLVHQIAQMQQGMLDQQARMNELAAAAAAPLSHQRDQDAATAAAAAAAATAALEEQRATQARLQSELEELQRSLASTLSEKEKLASQVRELRSHAERNKFALMEKVATLASNGQEQGRAAQQDRMLLATYEEDLRASRDAIAALQGMVAREAEHARTFREEKEAMQARLDRMASALGARERADAQASYAAGRASLRPADKLRSLMHKYMASFYRTQFQQLLSEKGSSRSRAERVEAELVRTREKHEMELVYQQRAHEAVLKHVNVSMQRREDDAEQLVERLEGAQEELQRVEADRQQKEQDLLASSLLNQQLAAQVASRAAETRDSAFADLMAASFKGDYLRMRNDTSMLRVVYGIGDEEIRFSDYVQRIDRHNRTQKRILIITERHILCLWADRGRALRRTIPIPSLRYVSLSRQSADLLVLHVHDAYDYLLLSSKRAEIMFHLLQLTSSLSGGIKTLAYKYGERVYVSDRDRKHRDVQVHENGIKLGEGSFRPHNSPQDEEEIRAMQVPQQPRISDSLTARFNVRL